jgi:hypothetical protein
LFDNFYSNKHTHLIASIVNQNTKRHPRKKIIN